MFLICNVIEYSSNYSKTSGSLWQHHKVVSNDKIGNSDSFTFMTGIAGRNYLNNYDAMSKKEDNNVHLRHMALL